MYSGAGCLPSLSACLLPGDCHLLIQTSRRFPQLDQYLPAACLSLLQGTNTTWSILCAYIYIYVFYCFTWDMTCLFVCLCMQVIEVLVRSEQGLFREVVKHLNQVEEQVLESLAWTSNSPLWETLRGAKDQVPACKQVQNLQQTPQHLRTAQRIHKHSCLFLCVCVRWCHLSIWSRTMTAAQAAFPSPLSTRDRTSTPAALSKVSYTNNCNFLNAVHLFHVWASISAVCM